LIMVSGIVVLAMFGFHLSRNKAIDVKKIMGGDDDEKGEGQRKNKKAPHPIRMRRFF